MTRLGVIGLLLSSCVRARLEDDTVFECGSDGRNEVETDAWLADPPPWLPPARRG